MIKIDEPWCVLCVLCVRRVCGWVAEEAEEAGRQVEERCSAVAVSGERSLPTGVFRDKKR